MAISWTRVLLVTLGLIGVGAVAGALLGSAVLLLVSLPRIAHWSADTLLVTLLFGTALGMPLGAVGAPLLSWLLLRRVPLGRALGITSLGTVVGSLIGCLVFLLVEGGGDLGSVSLVFGAVVGFFASAVYLRLRQGVRHSLHAR
jgi:hypothetical protein